MSPKQKLSEALDPAAWFDQIEPLIDWKKLVPLVPEFTEMLKAKGLNSEERFAFCYELSRQALKCLDHGNEQSR